MLFYLRAERKSEEAEDNADDERDDGLVTA